MSITPIADSGLVNMKKYSCMSVQYSRGCPFSCEFCDIIEIYGACRAKEQSKDPGGV